MNSSGSATTMDQIGKYWSMWGARRSSSSSSAASPISAWAAAAAYSGGSEPSWEEQAFARDAAAHLGGCVWPPRSYSCTFCQREFRSAQALGGHMNVHRRDRALLRQAGGSSSPEEDVHAPNDDHQPHPQQAGALLYRTAAAAASNPSTTTAPTTTAAAGTSTTAEGSAAAAMGRQRDGDANTNTNTTTTPTTTTPPSSYLSTIIKESSKNKLFMPMTDHSVAGKGEDQAAIEEDHQCDHHDDDGDGVQSARWKKRRRLDHPLAAAAALLIFVQPTAKAATDVSPCESQHGRRADHETKVPQTTSPSSSSPLLDHRQELDLELRLGTTPKVTYMAIHKAS